MQALSALQRHTHICIETNSSHSRALTDKHTIHSLVQDEGREGGMEEARGSAGGVLGLVGRMLTLSGAGCVGDRL